VGLEPVQAVTLQAVRSLPHPAIRTWELPSQVVPLVAVTGSLLSLLSVRSSRGEVQVAAAPTIRPTVAVAVMAVSGVEAVVAVQVSLVVRVETAVLGTCE